MEFVHKSVLLDETIENLNIKPDGIYVDGTLGGAGHSYEICKRLTTGKLIGIDQDLNAINAAKEKLKEFKDKSIIIHGNFSDISELISSVGINSVDGILLDIGVSSHQLDEAERGFSYQNDAPLDMRMDTMSDFSAYNLVNTYDEERISKVIFDYGEERFARRIARLIVQARNNKPIETTGELVDIIKKAIPASNRREGPHPAKRTFQALRIEVNRELDVLKEALEKGAVVLNKEGRFCVITFHSLEDRIVKESFNKFNNPCTCPPQFPVCVCGKKPTLKIITKKPIIASEKELSENPRSRSAKLRVAEKI